MFLLIISFIVSAALFLILRNTDGSSRKSMEAKSLRAAYHAQNKDYQRDVSIDDENGTDTKLKISELYIYPVKSLRGTRVSSALVTPEGFYLDRRYMLLKVDDTSPQKHSNMQISKFPSMALFETGISKETHETFTISFRGSSQELENPLELPFEPTQSSLAKLKRVHVDMYKSTCLAYDMGTTYNEWFSARFGFPVILAFWGGNARPVLGNLPGKAANDFPTPRTRLMKALKNVPLLGDLLDDEVGLAFNDMASFLVINDASVKEVTGRLGKEMDATKFRPNIIVKGSDTAYEEDYWAELEIDPGRGENACKLLLTANCVRCASLNVGYNGTWAEGKEGEVLKLLQKDRRVDAGMKYSPVFGRYGFPGRNDIGKVLRVGDTVVVSKRNKERTTFAWKDYKA